MECPEVNSNGSLPEAEAIFNAAVALHRAGRLPEAEQLYRRCLLLCPGHAGSLHLLGVVHYQRGAYADALRHIDLALAVAPRLAAAHNHRGAALQALHRADEALASYDHAIACDANYADAYYNRGNLLKERGRLEDALVDYDRATTLNPHHVDTLNNRGTTLRALGRLEDALASYDRAIELDPNGAGACYNRANVLADLNRFDEALASAERAIAINPQLAQAFNIRGNILLELKRLDEALASYDHAIAIRHDDAEAVWNRGLCRLLVGRCGDGWVDYEWRWKTDRMASERRNFKQSQWDGRADVDGKTVLLHAEQGFGDALMAVRYVRGVLARGARVILEVPAPLHALLAEINGIAQIVVTGHPLPDFDLHCPLMSLPLAFGTTLATIPAEVPYLSVPRLHAEKWRQRLPKSGKPRIGINWAGRPAFKRDATRSIGLARMLPLFARSNVHFFALQKELRDGDAEILQRHPQITPLGAEIETFADAAAIVCNLDLVISSDTSVVHLAGALGRPVWILLQYVPDWRWLLDRDDSPWYLTARLFRQPARDDWSGVVAKVEAELGRLAGGRDSAARR